jgi:hypothetical protein
MKLLQGMKTLVSKSTPRKGFSKKKKKDINYTVVMNVSGHTSRERAGTFPNKGAK